MSILHAYSQTVADGTATSVVRPSDWNSAHNMVLNIAGNTSGTSQISGSDIIWAGGNNITLSGNGSTVTIVGPTTVAQTVQTQASGNIVGQGFTSTTTAGTAIVATHNSAGLSMGVPAYLTTAAQSNHSHNFATTTTNGSLIVVGTTNSNGATIGVPAFLTTAAATNVTSGRAGTGTTLGFSGGLTGSMTLDTNGLNLALSELAGTDTWNAVGNTIAGQSTSGSWTNDVYAVSGAGGISVGVSNNTLILSGPTGGGGTTNQTGPNIAVAGSTITSGDVLFSNSPTVTFGMVGSTITASAAGGGGGAATESRWVGPANVFTTITSATASAMNGSLVFGNEYMPVPVSGTAIGLVHAHSVQSSYNVAQTITMSVSAAIYTKVNDTQASLYTSGSSSYQITWSSSTTSGIMGGNREIYIPMNFTLPAGDFVVARWMSFATNTSNANSHTISFLGAPHMTGAGVDGYGVASNSTGAPFLVWNGIYTTTTNAMPATIGRSQLIGASGAHGNFYREYRGT